MSVLAPAAAEADDDPALGDAAFAALMTLLGPFERAPVLAVAVSGGPDSMALCLLAEAWVRARGGRLTALIVDHGLRPESAAEARRTGAWLERRGICHRLLAWQGPKPTSAIQAAARRARYALLEGWCRAHGVLHLLLGHHQGDQHETRLLRAARGSGPDGLAAMAPVREVGGLRLLRPLLGVPKQRLIATLRAIGQPWIEDPSNHAQHFARARLRHGASAPQACASSFYAVRRADLDRRCAAWLAAVARIDPAGFVTWPRQALAEVGPEILRRALQQALAVVGGDPYPPRSVRLERLRACLAAPGFHGRTLAGCRILPAGADLLICREPAAIAPPLALAPGRWLRWDRRFLVRARQVGGCGPAALPELTVRALGADGWRQCRRRADGALGGLPAAVRLGLASVWCGGRLLAVARHGELDPLPAGLAIEFRYRPPQPLAGAPFAVPDAVSRSEPYPRIAANHTFASI